MVCTVLQSTVNRYLFKDTNNVHNYYPSIGNIIISSVYCVIIQEQERNGKVEVIREGSVGETVILPVPYVPYGHSSFSTLPLSHCVSTLSLSFFLSLLPSSLSLSLLQFSLSHFFLSSLSFQSTRLLPLSLLGFFLFCSSRFLFVYIFIPSAWCCLARLCKGPSPLYLKPNSLPSLTP